MNSFLIKALIVVIVFPVMFTAFRYLVGMPVALVLGSSPSPIAVAICGFGIFGLSVAASVWLCRKLWRSAEEYAV